nr:fatty acid amide hydrolase-like [Nicotiana tomentosiformis]
MAVKDDIDCYPHSSKGGATWFHEVHEVKKDAVCVSRLRNCDVLLVGKTNMHELALEQLERMRNLGQSGIHMLHRGTRGVFLIHAGLALDKDDFQVNIIALECFIWVKIKHVYINYFGNLG